MDCATQQPPLLALSLDRKVRRRVAASPKSATLARPSSPSSTFLADRSRCTTGGRWEWQCSRAAAMSSASCSHKPYSGRRCWRCSRSCRLSAASSCSSQYSSASSRSGQHAASFGAGHHGTCSPCMDWHCGAANHAAYESPSHLHHRQRRLQACCQDASNEWVAPHSRHHLHLPAA